jgi:small subunit ribosomal protein S8
VPSSKVKVAIAQVLKDEGYIDGFQVKTATARPSWKSP